MVCEIAGVQIAGKYVTEVMGLLQIIVKILAFILSDVADTKGFEPRRDAVSGLTGALWLHVKSRLWGVRVKTGSPGRRRWHHPNEMMEAVL